jgi:hypothetical protein
MTPERVSRLAGRWVRFYTRELPGPVAERRVDEIAADLHDHIAHERALGTSDQRIALAIVSRMARGVPADLAWRRHVRTSKGDVMKPLVALLAAALVTAVVALVLDSPVLVLLAILVIVVVIIGTFGISARAAVRGDFLVPFVATLAAALGLAALAVSAIVFGERGDAPGLVLLGIVMIVSVIVGAFALGVRTAQGSSR